MTRFVPVEELFRGPHFDREIVVLCVRWYLSFKLSYRDLVTIMSERGIDPAHTTVLRWVSTTSRNLKNAGTATLGPSVVRGGVTGRM
jgi:transposase-like protein